MAFIINDINSIVGEQSSLSLWGRGIKLAIDLAQVTGDERQLFTSYFNWYRYLIETSRWKEADTTWQILKDTNAQHNPFSYGYIELVHGGSIFRRGQLKEEYWLVVEGLIKSGNSDRTLRQFYQGRGAWWLEQDDWQQAITSLQEALRMARERSIPDTASETGLALAKFQIGQLDQPRDEAQRLAEARKPAHGILARLWSSIGDLEQARRHALAAYKEAWADGEPYVYRYRLTRASELLTQLGVPIPKLPDYDPAGDIPRLWEAEVAAAIDKLRKEKKGLA
jgi:tetratricopeptide (TPR) repeat protein